MKFILVFLVFLLSLNCFGQPPENTNSNVPVNNEVEEESNKSGKVMDSITLDLKDVELKRDKISSKKLSKNKSAGFSSKNEQQIQSVSTLKKEKTRSKYQPTSRSPTPQSQQIMDEEVEKLRLIDDQSFDYNLYNYVSGNYDVSREQSLELAEELDSENRELLIQIAANSMVKGDSSEAKFYLKKLINNGTLSKETIAYTEDVLNSSVGNDMLLTHGTKDSYGVAYNQFVKGNQYDEVCVISMDFMKSDTYQSLLKEKGIKIPKKETIDVGFFKEFCALNANKSISISMTFPSEYLKPIADQLVPYGLVFRTGKQKPLCATDLDELWNKKLNKKNLKEYSSAESKNYAKNYVPTVLILREFHESQDRNQYMKSGQKIQTQKKKADIEKKH